MMDIPIIVEKFNDGKVLYIEIYLNSNKSIFLLDTGASVSIIDKRRLDRFTSKELIQSYNITGVGESLPTYKTIIDKMKIGEVLITKRDFQVMDLLSLNNTFTSNHIRTIDGIIGNDIIFELFSSIDIENKLVKMKKTT